MAGQINVAHLGSESGHGWCPIYRPQSGAWGCVKVLNLAPVFRRHFADGMCDSLGVSALSLRKTPPALRRI